MEGGRFKKVISKLVLPGLLLVLVSPCTPCLAQERGIKAEQLNKFILEGSSNYEQRSQSGSSLYPRVSRRLDWMSDVLTVRNDAFEQWGNNYDSLADDPRYGRRMLRRATGRTAAALVKGSEFQELYEDIGDFFKQASEIFSVREDVNLDMPESSKGKSRIKGRRILSLGFDASNQFSPTLKVLNRFEIALEPFSERITSQARWEF